MGILDGQGSYENWWGWVRRNKDDKEKALALQNEPGSIPRLLELMGKGVPTSERIFGEGYYLRPSFIQPGSTQRRWL
jgi:hypothetical protein